MIKLIWCFVKYELFVRCFYYLFCSDEENMRLFFLFIMNKQQNDGISVRKYFLLNLRKYSNVAVYCAVVYWHMVGLLNINGDLMRMHSGIGKKPVILFY